MSGCEVGTGYELEETSADIMCEVFYAQGGLNVYIKRMQGRVGSEEWMNEWGWQSGSNANMKVNERERERERESHKSRGTLPGWMGREGGCTCTWRGLHSSAAADGSSA